MLAFQVNFAKHPPSHPADERQATCPSQAWQLGTHSPQAWWKLPRPQRSHDAGKMAPHEGEPLSEPLRPLLSTLWILYPAVGNVNGAFQPQDPDLELLSHEGWIVSCMWLSARESEAWGLNLQFNTAAWTLPGSIIYWYITQYKAAKKCPLALQSHLKAQMGKDGAPPLLCDCWRTSAPCSLPDRGFLVGFQPEATLSS